MVSITIWSLRPLIFFARVVAANTTRFPCFNCLTINHTRRWLCLSALQFTRILGQIEADRLPQAGVSPKRTWLSDTLTGYPIFAACALSISLKLESSRSGRETQQ